MTNWKRIEKSFAKTAWGLDGVVEHASIALITSFQYTSSWLVSCDTLLKHLCQSFGFARADSYKHVEHVKPFFTAPFDVLGIDILTRETVFKEVGGVVGGVRLSLSLLPPFFPHCLLAFFARRHQWPRAWQGLIQEPGNGLLTNIGTSLALAPAVTFAFTFRPCQPLLLAYSWASFGSKLVKIHATILTLRNDTIVSIRESNAVSLEKIIWKSLSDHWSNSIRGTEKKTSEILSVGVNVDKWLHVSYVSPYIVPSPPKFSHSPCFRPKTYKDLASEQRFLE